jgi:hypothetical protein
MNHFTFPERHHARVFVEAESVAGGVSGLGKPKYHIVSSVPIPHPSAHPAPLRLLVHEAPEPLFVRRGMIVLDEPEQVPGRALFPSRQALELLS